MRPKASHPAPDHASTSIRPSVTGPAGKLCDDFVRILSLYRKVIDVA
ncbi:MAG: hypothetical protein WBP56_01965 [Polyangia bacterium]